MAIYRKGENQFGLHESARLGQNRREMDRKSSRKSLMKGDESYLKKVQATDFMKEDIARQIAYEAGLEDVTVGQHTLQNSIMNAMGKTLGVDEDMSIPISGDDLARGAAGKKALEQLDFD
jgi:hypothetical protein